MNQDEIRKAVNLLLGVANGEYRRRDKKGFALSDIQFARSLIRQSEWSFKQESLMYEKLFKYRKQLMELGFNYSDLKKPVNNNE